MKYLFEGVPVNAVIDFFGGDFNMKLVAEDGTVITDDLSDPEFADLQFSKAGNNAVVLEGEHKGATLQLEAIEEKLTKRVDRLRVTLLGL